MSTRLHSVDDSTGAERQPWLMVGLCLFILLVPPYVVPLGRRILWPPLIVSVALLVVAVVQFAVQRRTTKSITVKPGILALIAYLLLRLVSFTHGGEDAALRGTDRSFAMIYLLSSIGIATYTMVRIVTPSQRSFLLGGLALGLVYMCAVGILQNYGGIDLRLLFQFPGLQEAHQTGQFVNVASNERNDALRSFGTADHAADFAVLAAVTIPLTIHFVRFASNRFVRLGAALGTGMAFIAVLAGGSRIGVLALAAAFLVYVWALKMRTLGMMAVGGGAVVVGLAAIIGPARVIRSVTALETAITEGSSLQDPSVIARVERYAVISQTFFEHPFFGLGSEVFAPGLVVYDNQWLKLLVEGGLTGLFALLVLAVSGIVGIAAGLRRATTIRQRDEVFVTGAMFAGILTSTFSIDLFLFAQITLVLFLSYGLLWSDYSVPTVIGPLDADQSKAVPVRSG